MPTYLQDAVDRLWDYRAQVFAGRDGLFDRPRRSSESPNRPPVFLKEQASHNVLTDPNVSETEKQRVFQELPAVRRHIWFWSMKSSQALVQSVFANLKLSGKLGLLSPLVCEDGTPLLICGQSPEQHCTLEFAVDYLGEPQPTEVDVLMDYDDCHVAVECKLFEQEVGACSNGTKPEGKCSGQYAAQRGREARCYLQTVGVKYWHYVPKIFDAGFTRQGTRPVPSEDILPTRS